VARSDTRVLPPLLYVFRHAHRSGDAKKPLDVRDSDGARIISGRRGLSRNPISEEVLQAEVRDNIVALLNTVHLEATEDLSGQPHVAKSILNYGIEDLTRLTSNDMRLDGVAQGIKRALINYERRLEPHTVVVTRDREAEKLEDVTVRFRVQADLVSTPLNIPVEFVAEADREHARFRIQGS
jgi:type VI secretion system protein ImpF